MFTPQQIEQVSFSKVTFGGYDIQSVDAFLEPLTEDYITLYKENALLKSKMRVLVGKLEEYRKNEASMKDAIVNAQKTCDMMVKEAESKCALMLSEANLAAAENTRNTKLLIAEENARVEEARRAASARIEELELQLKACVDLLEQIRTAHRPAEPAPVAEPETVQDQAGAVADEISQNLEAIIGEAEEPAVKPEPAPFRAELEATTKFVGLKFGTNGPNYSPSR